MPLREALVRLENEGIVEIRSRRGGHAVRRGIDEVVALIAVWAALECMAARLACAHACDDEIEALAKISRSDTSDRTRMQIDEYPEDNIRFHRRIPELSGCRVATEMGRDLFVKLEPVRRHAMQDATRTGRS
ncbi:MAG: FCD domain-containing protein, partial [Rhodobacteraceae bacterium]|nr:FCD domain-containing protein [Paracoccaceae bacterium]